MIVEKEARNIALGDRLSGLVLKEPQAFDFQIAQKYEQLLSAYRLVYREYSARGYCKPKNAQIHYTYFCALPESRTFLLVEKNKGRISGTVSLIPDTPCGLPMESLFDRELRRVRKEGRRLAEVTLLTVSAEYSAVKTGLPKSIDRFLTILAFFRMLFQYARRTGITDLVITVSPKHESIYRYLTFDSLGEIRPYPGACGTRARPMHLDMVKFCDPELKDRPVQKYFLSESNLQNFDARPAHWDFKTVEKLFQFARPLEREATAILESYLKSSKSFT